MESPIASQLMQKICEGVLMFKQLFPGTIAVLVLVSAPLMAKDAPAPAPAATPPELAQLAVFESTLNCAGKAFASPMAPEHATTGTVHGNRTVGGMWINLNYDEKKTAANPAPYHIGVYMGFDAGKKTFVQGCVDSFGGYCTESSTGWNGDTLVFEGTSNSGGQQFGSRDTFVKKSANELVHTGEMQGADKQWVKTDEETCHKNK